MCAVVPGGVGGGGTELGRLASCKSCSVLPIFFSVFVISSAVGEFVASADGCCAVFMNSGVKMGPGMSLGDLGGEKLELFGG